MDANDLFRYCYDQYAGGNDNYLYNVVDLDPYAEFLSWTAVSNMRPPLHCIFYSFNVRICCTFTDLKVLSGPDFEKCFYYYGVSKSKTGSLHEVLFSKECFTHCPLLF